MLLVYTRISIKSVQKYRYSILVTAIWTLYLREQGCEYPLVIFQSQKGSVSTKVWETLD